MVNKYNYERLTHNLIMKCDKDERELLYYLLEESRYDVKMNIPIFVMLLTGCITGIIAMLMN